MNEQQTAPLLIDVQIGPLWETFKREEALTTDFYVTLVGVGHTTGTVFCRLNR
ncbi:hypothetical protein NDK47_00870 [Brevibacillus ruminantium]|uniref:Uncharacterized protein n=1 Tax=Brevibacillus ruminantium TaxID=2950604 RepID=A0ABY4WGJ8_9BACL|nr:hypothetical protein [Brevibacillus ruminantium]USG65941.1 hypothetical protein NDK47_00870 [Brevibacillus ruminantium]